MATATGVFRRPWAPSEAWFNRAKLLPIGSSLNNYVMPADAGAFTLTGQDVAFRRTLRLVAEAASFTFTGKAVLLEYGRRFGVDAGAFVLTGKDTGGLYGRRLVAGAGSFALVGKDVALTRSRLLTAGAGAFVFTGKNVNLNTGIADPGIVQPGAFVFTGMAVDFTVTRYRVGPVRLAPTVVSAAILSGGPQLSAGRLSTSIAGSKRLTSRVARP